MKLEQKDRTLYTTFNPMKVARMSIVKRFRTTRAAAGISIYTPLGELKEALEDEKEAEKFLADPMFWRDFTSIEQSRIFRTTSVEYRNLWLMFWETLFYIFFVVMFTMMIFALQSPDVYECKLQQHDYWLGCDESGCRVDMVKDMTSFWQWMTGDFIDNIFTDAAPFESGAIANITTKNPALSSSFANNGYVIVNTPRMVGETNTIVMLGAVRVRQQRVERQTGCMLSELFRHVIPDCFPAFSAEAQSNRRYSTRYTPTYLNKAFEWQPEERALGSPLTGDLADYSGDGYFFDIPADKAAARQMLRDLWEWKWVDRATRGVIIEMVILNINTNVMLSNRIAFEFGPTGVVQYRTVMNAFRAMFVTWAAGEGEELTVFLFQSLVTVAFLLLFSYLVWMMRRVGLTFFKSGWNILDCTLCGLWVIYLYERYVVFSVISTEPTMAPRVIGHPEVFSAFTRNIRELILANHILSFLALLVYFKFLKYLNLSSMFRMLNEVIVDCAGRLARFAVLIVVIFCGFGVAFYVGLGQTDQRFARLDQSFLRLFFMFVEGITMDANWFEPNSGTMLYIGPNLSLAYLIGVYFILSSIFMAIVLDAYVSACVAREARKTGADLIKRNPMQLFLYTYYHKLRKLSLLTDDEALPEEQSILLVDLPGIVVRKWLEKKRRMQLLVDKTLGDMSEEEWTRRMQEPAELQTARSRQRKKSSWRETLTKIRKNIQRSMSLPLAEEFEIPEPARVETRARLYSNAGYSYDEEISLLQLQSLIDQEPTLQILLGTKSALDVIRYFKPMAKPNEDDEDVATLKTDEEQAASALDKIGELQENVFRKVEHLEKRGLNMDRKPVPHVDHISELISTELLQVQNGWREEFTKLIEQMTSIADGMKDTKVGVEQVCSNHEELAKLLGEGSSEYDSTTESDSESEEESEEAPPPTRKSILGIAGPPKMGKRGSI
jgi:hypothetical protein